MTTKWVKVTLWLWNLVWWGGRVGEEHLKTCEFFLTGPTAQLPTKTQEIIPWIHAEPAPLQPSGRSDKDPHPWWTSRTSQGDPTLDSSSLGSFPSWLMKKLPWQPWDAPWGGRTCWAAQDTQPLPLMQPKIPQTATLPHRHPQRASLSFKCCASPSGGS